MPEGLPDGQEVPWRMKRVERTGPLPDPPASRLPEADESGWAEHYWALTNFPFVRRAEPAFSAKPDSRAQPPLRPRPVVHRYDDFTPAYMTSAGIAATTAAIIALS